MSHPTPITDQPTEVHEFVARVRLLLADLDPEEQQELTAGLEADLGDLVAERGIDALDDPAAYASELRVAAGHAAVMAPRPGGRTFRAAVMDAVDTTHASWDRLLDSLPGDLRGFLTALQPAWWVLRAAVACLFVQNLRGPYIVIDVTWLLILAGLVVVSVQLGRGAWGLERLLSTSVLARLALIVLNVFALAIVPATANDFAWHIAEERAYQFEGYYDLPEDEPAVITYQGDQVCDLEVRAGDGAVVTDGYVWDVTGNRPLPMHNDMC
jgi:hypothetical protein